MEWSGVELLNLPAVTGLIIPIWCTKRFGPMLLWANRRGKAGWGQNRRERTAGQTFSQHLHLVT